MSGTSSGATNGRINRYIMECKYEAAYNLEEFEGAELIDTLWNVNKDAKKVILEYSGINRYIMECKQVSPLSFLFA